MDVLTGYRKASIVPLRNLSLELRLKLSDVWAAKAHRVRRITEEDVEELGIVLDDTGGAWFPYDGRQLVVRKREDGQHVVFKV